MRNYELLKDYFLKLKNLTVQKTKSETDLHNAYKTQSVAYPGGRG